MGILIFIAFSTALIIFILKAVLGPVKFNYKTYFLSGVVNHNEINSLERGECLLKFDKDRFYIIQNKNTVEDIIADIEKFRIWTYENGLYLAIDTKTHNEYKFSLIEPEKNNETSTELIIKIFSGLARKIKVELVEE